MLFILKFKISQMLLFSYVIIVKFEYVLANVGLE